MRLLSSLLLAGLLAGGLPAVTQAQTAPATFTKTDSLTLRKFYDEALLRGQSYENLRYLCEKIGGRLAGSPQAAQAVAWGKLTMEKAACFDKVYLQECQVPHWVRGAKEKGQVFGNKGKGVPMAVCALGGSVATPGNKPLRAGVVEVKTLAELKALPDAAVKGKFVFFNRPFDDALIEPGAAYGGAGDQRRSGPAEAGRRGAVGALVRSLTSARDNNPHTGTTSYGDTPTKVPGAALSTLAADQLSQLLKADPSLQFELEMSCQTLPDVTSYNVIGEVRGSKYPDQIITVGGHLDSWDLAQGAHDDGTGVVQSIEAVRLLKAAGLRPERTVRAVLFMNEENGTRGGNKYAEQAKQNNETHVAAIESDGGGFTPRGFNVESTPAVFKKVAAWGPLLAPYHANELTPGHSGTDIEPLVGAVHPTALFGYDCDSQRYFDIHHTAADTFDKVNRRELELGGASMASLIYLLSKYGLQ
ncbi:M20/M25/M40 family metallo-hydrolase [Hymenobacter setariae]|uniref:Carboxypeptidase Q n=1 Tax=Hymenobacter setariae TaxID=2594794 RepID=A0A558C2E6_9BACT|nr:M20/M25/M40 family metallo-hydrolase [Hymenobacter setariae]TVT42949.1 M20/M25/M40 family metallo-hydrolase [Hymenobacter setariae]